MLPIKPLDLPPDKMTELAKMLIEKFALCKRARQSQIDDKYNNWQRNYDALPAQETRTVPYYRASNFMPHLIRMHSDILAARIIGFMISTKPFWRVRSILRDAIDHNVLENLSLGMNYLWDTDLYGAEVTDHIVNQTLQTGTLTCKSIWSDSTTEYMGPDGNFLELTTEGMEYEPVPFEDFWPYPITARNTRRAEILFHRIRLTERSVRERRESKKWDDEAAGLVLKEPVDPSREIEAMSSGINLTPDVDYPYSAVECWLHYEIAGKKRPIVVLLNPLVAGEKAILRSYYNFMPYGDTVFTDFRAFPRKNSYFGYAVPEILEASQEEQAQIHNGRRDANTIANIPSFKKKRFAEVPNPATDWYPGCIIELDEMDDLEAFAFGTNYNSMIDEEQFLMSLAERYIGISPSMQGFGAGQAAGKRGIYSTGGTLALMQEGNKRLDIYMHRMRAPFHRIGRQTALSYNQWNPSYWDKYGKKGMEIRGAFDQIDPASGQILYDLAASEASSNREVDRQNLFQASNLMASYYQKIIELAGMVRQIPPGDPLREVSMLVLDGAHDLVRRMLFAFDIGDRDRIAPDLRPVLEPTEGPGTRPNGHDTGGLPTAAGSVRPSELEDLLKNLQTAGAGARQ
jgi:hypothetical protein